MKKLLFFLCLMLAGTLSAVPFTLRNSTLKAIPLEIPGVMNPNLSPLSNSGVDLCVGQKIYCTIDGERIELIEVSEDLKDKKLNVAKLIREQRKALKKAQA
jgi:hypothetical protein